MARRAASMPTSMASCEIPSRAAILKACSQSCSTSGECVDCRSCSGSSVVETAGEGDPCGGRRLPHPAGRPPSLPRLRAYLALWLGPALEVARELVEEVSVPSNLGLKRFRGVFISDIFSEFSYHIDGLDTCAACEVNHKFNPRPQVCEPGGSDTSCDDPCPVKGR